MLSDLAVFLQFYAAIFAIINPLGMMPAFVSLTGTMYVKDRNKTNFLASMSVGIILLISLLIGNIILSVFSISIDAFRIAGSVLLIGVAMQMLGGKIGDHKQNKEEKAQIENLENNIEPSSIAVIPLAIPMLAGPGAIGTAIIWGSRHQDNLLSLFGLSITAVIFSITLYIIFRLSPIIIKLLGNTGASVLTRIMGLLLLSIGAQMIIVSISNLFPGLLK